MIEHNFTDDQIKAVRKETKKTTRAAMKRYIGGAVIGYLLLAVGVGFAVQGNTNALNDSRHRGAQVRNVICTILQQSDQLTYARAAIHQITMKELGEILQITAHYREEVGEGYEGHVPNCTITIPVRQPKEKATK